MKTFKSFVTKRSLDEAVPQSKIDNFNKILFITLTQGKLELDSSPYKYFLGELEDNGFNLNLTMLDNFVSWFSSKFKNVFTWTGKSIYTSLKTLSEDDKKVVSKGTSELLTAIYTRWNVIKNKDEALKKEDPNGNYIILNKSFSEVAVEVLECTDEESEIARYFTAAY